MGIHAHDDTACAVANSLAAVDAGATHVQGTANGYGERCGNADLFSVVAALETKLERQVLPPGRLVELGRVAHAVAEVANIAPDAHQPWVGASAFAHKAGLHVSAVKADPDLYQHADPAVVGNDMRLLVSELAGRATIELKGLELGLEPDRDTVARVIERVKDLESVGWSFEAAEASFELLLREEMGERPRFFDLESWRVIVERRAGDQVVSEATVKLHAKGERIVATGEGNGPVNALDNALRIALAQLYPGLAAARAGRLQGAHRQRRARHVGGHPRARGDLRRHHRVGHRRRARERHRGVLAGAGGRVHDRAAPAGVVTAPAGVGRATARCGAARRAGGRPGR